MIGLGDENESMMAGDTLFLALLDARKYAKGCEIDDSLTKINSDGEKCRGPSPSYV